MRELADALEDKQWAPKWRSLVTLQAGTTQAVNGSGAESRTPLFLVPGAASTSIGFTKLARALGPEQPVYGFDSLGLDGRYAPHDSIEQMAADYISEMKLVQPQGPYCVGGRCFGVLVAVEMVHQLEQQGDAVQFVAILDSGALRGQEYMRLADDPRARWQRRRQDLSPVQIVQQSLVHRRRRLLRRFKRYRNEPVVVRQRTDAALSAHRHAWKLYEAKPVQSRMLVFLCQQYMREGYNDDWHGLALGDYAEYPSEQWSHLGFMDNPENLALISRHLEQEIMRAAR